MNRMNTVVPLVVQLRFARAEFARCLLNVSEADGMQCPPSMNSLSWIVGHLAEHEQHFYVIAAQQQSERVDFVSLLGADGQPATPSFTAMWNTWQSVTAAADRFLDALTIDQLTDLLVVAGRTPQEEIGTVLQRSMYHYWFHTGEACAVRQVLGHHDAPNDFVGAMTHARYRPEHTL